MSKFTKHLRLQLDFTVTIDESAIPTTGVHATPYRSGDHEGWLEADECQRRLFKALLANKSMYEAYLIYTIATDLGSMTWQAWQEFLVGTPSDNLEEVLQPTIETLDKTAQEYFATAKENETFFECTEEFQSCFQTVLDDASIVDMGDEA